MKLVLDTNAYCDYAEGVPSVVEILAEYGEEIFLPSVVIGELTYGFMKGTKRAYNERKLREVIEKLRIEIIDINVNVARKYALIYFQLINKGRKIPLNDVWIAASCLEVGGTLVSSDGHFEAIESLDRLPTS
ncbi:MAG TPA: type II toxin-antitoxin system VapC family toxin [Spirochaetales bacterium]|nr:type II toxin-antitoxin system VapC family toxin [Spirochaetales bacterium]